MNSVFISNINNKTFARVKRENSLKYKNIFWLFMVGSVIGFVLEGLNSVVKAGHWEHHSATIWGPFCIIYGIGAVAVFVISHILSGRNHFIQFIVFSISGALVEYFGSLFQEIFIGSTHGITVSIL